MNTPVILVDGSSYLFRAYYAMPPLTNAQGHPTGAMYGVINMLRKLLADYQPEHVAIVFDAKAKTFRHDLYPDYKANRAVMPEELAQQIEPLHEIIRAMGFPLLIQPGVEADDIIGTLAKQATQQKIPLLISTGDKDMAQLVNHYVTLVNTMTDKIMDVTGVKEKFGVIPEQIIDYLTLIGDTVDNIPGVPKVGPKTAAKWLNTYKNLDELIAAADTIKGKVGENLRNHLDDLALTRQLVTIKTDVDLKENVTELALNEPDKKKLKALFSNYEFKHWVSELSEEAITDHSATSHETIFTEQAFNRWLKLLTREKIFAFDTETTSLNAKSAELVGVSFAISGKSAYLPLAHDYDDAPQQLARDKVLDQLKPLLANPEYTVIGHNLKYDMEVLEKYQVTFQAKLVDTLLESYVINSVGSRHDMDTLALKYLQHQTITFEDVAGKGVKQKTFNEIDIETASSYAAEDAAITLALHQKLYPLLEQDKQLKSVFDNLDMPLVAILMRMESHGVLLDCPMLEKQSEQLGKEIDALQQKAYKLAGQEFNLSSPKQLQEILFEQLKLPVLKKTPGGQASTAEAVLQELALDFPLPAVILSYRSLSKLKSTYTDKLPQQIDPKSKRVHTSYNQAVTSTGRLSSNNPNLQNIPIRTEEGRKIRKAFIAPESYRLIAADYSQIELRIIAHVSQDPGLLQAFNQGLDVHRATAAEVFNTPFEQVTNEQRRHAKSINFGLLYGMSAFGLSKNLNISKDQAQQYMDVYFQRYPNVHTYMQEIGEFAEKHGYVETLWGRRIYIPDIQSSNKMRKKAAERIAINAPMQGSAADIIKKAMICVDEWLQNSKLPAHMIMQVHDELVLEVENSAVETAMAELKRCMEAAATLSVPLLVEMGIGNNWDEAH